LEDQYTGLIISQILYGLDQVSKDFQE
jgi:hypothetical protein